MDLILWDRLQLFWDNNAGEGHETPLFPMQIVTEHSLQAVSTDGQTVVTGRADYVVGYSTTTRGFCWCTVYHRCLGKPGTQ